MPRKVTLLGATGFTGGLIAELLQEARIEFSMSGRDSGKMQALNAKLGLGCRISVVDLDDPASVDKLLRESEILINCIGPYDLYSGQLTRQAAGREIIYLDLTGEQAFVARSVEENHRRARDSGAVIVHSMAFESALADLLAERACKTGSSYSDISSYYRVMSAVESGGTSTTRRLARYRETWRWSDSRRLPTAALHHTQMLELATGSERGYFVAYPEIVFFSRRYKTASSGSYFLFPEHLAKALIRFQSAPAEPMQTIVEQHQSGRGPDAASRAKERWKVFVRVMAVGGGGKVAVARGSDCYGTTASIVAAAVTYLSSTTPHAHGVMGPADLLPAELLGRFGAVEEFDLR